MGDGDLSPINPRKSYIVDKKREKGATKPTQKVTETDP
jgi:hypothetical protein